MQPTITMTEAPEPHVREAIVGPLIVFNNSRASQPEDYRPLVIILSDPDTGGILGGLWGETNFAHLHVDLLFVPERCEAPVSVDKCCFRQSKKRRLWLSRRMVGYVQLSGARFDRASGVRCVWHPRRLPAGSELYLSAQNLCRVEPRPINGFLRSSAQGGGRR